RLKAIVLAAFLDEGSQAMVAPSIMVEARPGDGPPEPAAKDTLGTVRTALLEMNVDREIALELTFGRLVADFVRKFRPPNPVAAQQGALRLATSLAVALSTSLGADADQSAPSSAHRDKVVAGAHQLATRNGPTELMDAYIRFCTQILADPKSSATDVA